MDRGEQEVVDRHGGLQHEAVRKFGACFVEELVNLLDYLRCIGAGALEHDYGGTDVAVVEVGETVGKTAEFYLGDVSQAEYLAVVSSADHDVLELRGILQTSLILHGVLERLVALLAEGTGSGLDVLLGECRRNVGGHQAILRHDVGFQPYTHRIVGTKGHGLADTGNTLDLRYDVDRHIVVDELGSVFVGVVIQSRYHEHGALALLRNDTYLVDLGGKESRRLGHTVLHVHGSHVRVHALFEVNLDGGRTVVGCRRHHVIHVLGTVYLLLKRLDHRVQNRLGVGTRIGGADADGRWRDVGILLNRETHKTQQTEYHDEHRDNGREHRSVYESV